MSRVVDDATARAGDGGLALVAVGRAAPLGRIGAYPEALARRGYLALAFCSVPTWYHDVAWFGAKTGVL